MRRTFAALAPLLVLGLVPNLVLAQPTPLQIVGLRAAYGSNGVARKDARKILPGDVLWMDFAIEGLKVDKTTNKVSYDTLLQFFDSSDKPLFERRTPNEAVLALGGQRMPGDMHIKLGDTFKPGKYTIKLTIKDKLANKEFAITHPLEVMTPAFGFVQVEAPALGLPGTPSGAQMLITGFALDSKKQPKVDVTITVLDANEKAVSLPMVTDFPAAIPAGVPQPVAALPVSFPITVLNRPGQFYIDIVAVDKNANNKEIKLRLPLTVLDVGAATGASK